jgi:hypothetical protein
LKTPYGIYSLLETHAALIRWPAKRYRLLSNPDKKKNPPFYLM